MEMTPEKLAFIKGQPATESDSELSKTVMGDAAEKRIELKTAHQESEAVTEPRAKPGRRATRSRAIREIPEASELLDQVLVPVTIRLQHRTAQALRRAHLEQRLKHAKPDTQQEIVEEALGDWLVRQGFLE